MCLLLVSGQGFREDWEVTSSTIPIAGKQKLKDSLFRLLRHSEADDVKKNSYYAPSLGNGMVGRLQISDSAQGHEGELK